MRRDVTVGKNLDSLSHMRRGKDKTLNAQESGLRIIALSAICMEESKASSRLLESDHFCRSSTVSYTNHHLSRRRLLSLATCTLYVFFSCRPFWVYPQTLMAFLVTYVDTTKPKSLRTLDLPFAKNCPASLHQDKAGFKNISP